MNFEMNLQLQLRLMDIPEHNYRMITLLFHPTELLFTKGGKKRIHHNRLLLLTCTAGFFPRLPAGMQSLSHYHSVPFIWLHSILSLLPCVYVPTSQWIYHISFK